MPDSGRYDEVIAEIRQDFANLKQLEDRLAAEVRETEPAPLLCWCCAQWFITAPAVCGRTRLCAACLDSTRAQCKDRHMASALAVAGG